MKLKSKFRTCFGKKKHRPFQFWKMSKGKVPDVLVAAIDQGTSSSRVLLFDPRDETKVVAQAQEEFDCIYPKEGWAEQDPMVLVDTVKRVSEH